MDLIRVTIGKEATEIDIAVQANMSEETKNKVILLVKEAVDLLTAPTEDSMKDIRGLIKGLLEKMGAETKSKEIKAITEAMLEKMAKG